ncbi:protein DEHYDRATION-INDUCED 19-like [Dioscorea cayenensis subsp. rotundata]|uniref:Protein DEHYDRATION-INDUCED 19-like n=1 Tax=Dioscorea cayennensis subsp. rotundata TaxID=55577 RepID=A0AB40AYB2_DIOCR|nr:protein DEHYDRATION-INDUCED 19-like [Dioscorea cayenensis subsp. rotundata]
MDSDLWIARLAAAKRNLALQHQHQQLQQHSSQADRLSIDDFEVEEEFRPDFPCPYCYEEHDISSLCSHLEDEHPFESKAAVCPICSAKVTRDMLNHITVQHGHLFRLQRRRKLQRVAIPSSQALSLLGRDLREAHIQVLLGSGGYRSRNNNASSGAADSFLSSLVLNFPTSEAEESLKSLTSKDSSIKRVTPSQTWKSSSDSFMSYEEREKQRKQAIVRANFIQDLLLSTLFGD